MTKTITLKTLAAYLGACLLTLATAGMAAAQTQTVWTGAVDSLWFEAGNWSNGLPAAGNDAVVPTGSAVVIDGLLDADFGVQSFGDLTAEAQINVRATFASSGTLSTNSRVNVFGELQNFGALALGVDGSLYTAPSGKTRSNGTIANEGWVGARGELINEGLLTVAAGAGLAVYETGTFSNPGVVDLAGFYNNRDGGEYSAPSGGTVNVLDGGRLDNYGGARMVNAGILDVQAGGLFRQRATLINNPGRLFVSGLLRTFDGSATASNFTTVRAGGTLDIDRGDYEVVFSLVNEGVTRVNQPVAVRGIVQNATGATLNVVGAGELDFTAGTNLENAGRIDNAGVITTIGTISNATGAVFVNTGTVRQNSGGAIVNDGVFRNKALLENINGITNNDRFFNEGRMTNGSGGIITNNSQLRNFVDAHIENQFRIVNDSLLINEGYFENGVIVDNNAIFRNYGFLDNVGDVTNAAGAVLRVYAQGVIDNSGAGILTNLGRLVNDGEINNFDCGVINNEGRIDNAGWINNEGLYFENGTLDGMAVMGSGPVVAQDGTSPLICQPFKQKLDQNGSTRVSATRFAAAKFDSCAALQYLIDDEESLDFTCADLGVHQVTISLVDRKGNRINCGTTVEITDEFAPRITNACPGDIELLDVDSAPVAATWTPPTFDDNCDADVTVTATHQPGDLFPEGTTVVTYAATDDSGNEFVCEFSVRVTVKPAPPACEPKDHNGLLAYFNLVNGSSKYVTDRAAYGEPLHMEIKNTSSIRWDNGGCGLVNTGESIVKSYEGARQLGRRLQMTNALTVEAWVRSAKLQSGPERIVTYSENTGKRNFTLGQQGDRYVFRLKTTHTNDNGTPDRQSHAGAVKVGQVQHLVFTRDANGRERFYVDGQLQYSGHVGGNFSNWGTHCHLALFNEMTLDRSFRGAIKKVAIYDRAWSQAEVLANEARGACGCDDSPRGNTCEGERGQVTYERYDGIDGNDLPWLYKSDKFPKRPDATRKLTKLQIPSDAGSNYGSRTRGFIYPNQTGDYRFAVSGDDWVTLLVSGVADNPSGAYKVASIRGYTNPGELHKYSSQKSHVMHLQAGKAYYFELYQKEGSGGDHAAVYWKRPGASNFSLIGAQFIGDVKACDEGQGGGNDCAGARGTGLLREVWTGINSSDIWALFADPRYPDNPTSSGLIDDFRGPRNVGDAYGTRVRGFLHVDVTGDYRFTVTGDNQTKFMLSTDETEANSRPVAELTGWTGVTEFHKFSSQNSGAIRLEAGRKYYVELAHQEGSGGDHFGVYWRTPNNSTRAIIPKANLSPYAGCEGGPAQPTCNRDVLFVVGSTHLNNGDAAVKRRLQDLGYNVMVKDAEWANAAMAAGKGLVLISSTVQSGRVNTKFTDVQVPVMTWESWLYDDLKMTAGAQGTDYGRSGTQKLVVVGQGELTAGRTGHQNVFTVSDHVAYGKVMGTNAHVVAHAPADPWLASIFAYEAGQQMAGGKRAPAKRIGFFLDDDGAAKWNSYGKALFDAAVRYATDCQSAGGQLTRSDLLELFAAPAPGEVELEWVNNTGFKNDRFLVERSVDGIAYETLGEATGARRGEDVETLRFVDAAPIRGANHYRITALYADGTQGESEVRVVDFATRLAASVYPNPARERVTVGLDRVDGHDAELTLTDPLGRIVYRADVTGYIAHEISVANLPSGWYTVTVRAGATTLTERLAVQR